jgi:hypothetical protein
VSERLEEPGTEEAAPELTPDVAVEDLPSPAWSGTSWLRLAYSFEFLLALLTIFTVWSEVGGQGHLDLMPWYTKLSSVMAAAWCCVRFTASIVEQERVWNRRTIAWLAALIILAITMAGITYYFHLHEEQDQPDSEETTTTAMISPYVMPGWVTR